MEYLKIKGGARLVGEFFVKSAKNSVLPIMACSILASEPVIIKNVPKILDVYSMIEILQSLGAICYFYGDSIYIDSKSVLPKALEKELGCKLRSSFFLLGPLIARFKKASLPLPGGCAIGSRPIDIHLESLKKLGVSVLEENERVVCSADRLSGAKLKLKFPSVGATENLMMAAVLANGKTTIYGCAKEPEIVDLASFINCIGGKVYGAGSSIITIEGVKKLKGCTVEPSYDRIVAPSFLYAAAATGGEVSLRLVKKTTACHNSVFIKSLASSLAVLKKVGCKITISDNRLTVSSKNKLKALGKICTGPFPNFPTDMQAQLAATMLKSNGKTIIEENIFESRFNYANELKKLGAKIDIEKNRLSISGVKNLDGSTMRAKDLRGGAALVIAALSAEGESTILDPYHIDRGYERIEGVIGGLGGDIVRVVNNS